MSSTGLIIMLLASAVSLSCFDLCSSLKFLLGCSDVPEKAQLVAVLNLLSWGRQGAPMTATSMLIMGLVVGALFPSIFDRFASFVF